jgi:hypothetical protein
LGDESAHADFTIDDANTASKVAKWLATGSSTSSQSTGGSIMPTRYHIEVKATSGKCEEPFSMSSNQNRLVSLTVLLLSMY